MKKMLMCLLAACTLLGMVACSDGGDANGNGQPGDASLVGLWEVTGEYDGELDEWDYEFGEQYAYVMVMEFRSDGTGYEQDTDGTLVEKNDFGYTFDGATISIVTADGESGAFGVDKLTRTELVLSETRRLGGKSDLLVLKRIR